jgi:AbiV family abortive infection protein
MVDKEEKQRPIGGLDAVEAALAYGGRIYDNAKDFDVAIDHVLGLLDDAALLFERGSFGTATFVAITALEEIGKAHVSLFRRDKPEPSPRSRDPLRDHKAKHRMAVQPTVFMTDRIIRELGRERADALQDEAQTTGFTALREAALYCARNSSGFESPRMAIAPLRAWESLILAIEAADDALVGYTNHSNEIGKAFELLFARIAAQRPSS